jgi:hypothetical protein
MCGDFFITLLSNVALQAATADYCSIDSLSLKRYTAFNVLKDRKKGETIEKFL